MTLSRCTSAVVVICLATLLLFAFSLYRDAYFGIDDFNNLYWVQQWTFGQMLQQLVSPSTEYFRPVGMLLYWTGLNSFDRDPRPYHWLMWAIHTVNVALVFVILKRFTGSREGAAVGAMLFAYPAVFTDIFTFFGTIFELAGFALFLAGLLTWDRKERSFRASLLSAVVFILALKAKEMAITLPAIWLLQDLLIRRSFGWRKLSQFALPAVVAARFAVQKVSQMSGSSPGHPYYIDLSGLTMGRGFAYYFNTLFAADIRWQHWSIGFVALLLLMSLLRQWRAVFFQSYVFITFLPLIFMVNHREPFYWYFPLFGICGLAALAVQAVSQLASKHVAPSRLAPVGMALFAFMCWRTYLYSSETTRERRAEQAVIARDYRNFVEDLQRLSTVPSGETLFFTSVPDRFDTMVLKMAAQVALRRTDIDAQHVEEFPENATIRLEFRDGHVQQPTGR